MTETAEKETAEILVKEFGFTSDDVAEYADDIASAVARATAEAAESDPWPISITVRAATIVAYGSAAALTAAIDAVLDDVNDSIDAGELDEARRHAERLADGPLREELLAEIVEHLGSAAMQSATDDE